MPHRTNLIPEDGARPEITEASVYVSEATGVQFEADDPAIGQISELHEQGRMGRISRDFDLPPKTMNGPPDRPCAETHNRERQ